MIFTVKQHSKNEMTNVFKDVQRRFGAFLSDIRETGESIFIHQVIVNTFENNIIALLCVPPDSCLSGDGVSTHCVV